MTAHDQLTMPAPRSRTGSMLRAVAVSLAITVLAAASAATGAPTRPPAPARVVERLTALPCHHHRLDRSTGGGGDGDGVAAVVHPTNTVPRAFTGQPQSAVETAHASLGCAAAAYSVSTGLRLPAVPADTSADPFAAAATEAEAAASDPSDPVVSGAEVPEAPWSWPTWLESVELLVASDAVGRGVGGAEGPQVGGSVDAAFASAFEGDASTVAGVGVDGKGGLRIQASYRPWWEGRLDSAAARKAARRDVASNVCAALKLVSLCFATVACDGPFTAVPLDRGASTPSGAFDSAGRLAAPLPSSTGVDDGGTGGGAVSTAASDVVTLSAVVDADSALAVCDTRELEFLAQRSDFDVSRSPLERLLLDRMAAWGNLRVPHAKLPAWRMRTVRVRLHCDTCVARVREAAGFAVDTSGDTMLTLSYANTATGIGGGFAVPAALPPVPAAVTAEGGGRDAQYPGSHTDNVHGGASEAGVVFGVATAAATGHTLWRYDPSTEVHAAPGLEAEVGLPTSLGGTAPRSAVSQAVLGTGLHREVRYDIAVDGVEGGAAALAAGGRGECRVVLQQRLSVETYLDYDELRTRERFGGPSLHAFAPHIEIERPAAVSSQHVALLSHPIDAGDVTLGAQSTSMTVSVTFPFHLRYQKPKECDTSLEEPSAPGACFARAVLPLPSVHVGCGAADVPASTFEYTLAPLGDDSGSGGASRDTGRAQWVPVGVLNHETMVSIATALVTLLGAAVIVVLSLRASFGFDGGSGGAAPERAPAGRFWYVWQSAAKDK